MRISRRIQLAGLAAAMAGGASQAAAADLTVTTSTTTPVVTSNANGGAGDVIVDTGGSILVTSGVSAVTIDSDNDVTNTGIIGAADDTDNARGIRVTGARVGNITNNTAGSIRLVEEDNPLDDTDDDGDLDGPYATGTNRIGIFLDSGSLLGDIMNNGSIVIEGNNSAGIRIDGLLNGDLGSTGAINVTGDNSHAILINGDITGDALLRSTITVRGENSSVIELNGDITGQLRINGTLTAVGFHNTIRPADVSDLDADDLLESGPTVAIHGNVGGGVTLEGVGVEDDLDDDDDGSVDDDGNSSTTDDSNDDAAASVRSFGSSPAVLVSTNGTSIALGANGDGWGFQNRGGIIAEGIYDGFASTGVRFQGTATETVTVAGGIVNDRAITTNSVEANTYGVFIGEGVTTPLFMNRGAIASTSRTENADNAYGIVFDGTANLTTGDFVNLGTIRASVLGEVGGAYAIVDNADTVDSIVNTGSIIARVVATDSDLDDDITPVANGPAVAIDLSTSNQNVTITQQTEDSYLGAFFTDDDAVDNVDEHIPQLIQGDILFGAGNDTLNLLSGDIEGDVDFGGGTGTFLIDNGATYTGSLSTDTGLLTLNVNNGDMNLRGGNFNISSATFGSGSTLGVLLDPNPLVTTFINASGTVTFAPGAVVRPDVPSGLPLSDTQVFLNAAGGLFGGANVTCTLTCPSASYLYQLEIALTNPGAANGDPNGLEASYQLKTPTQLGMNDNQGAAFNAIIDALRGDDAAADAISSLDNAFDFFDAYEDLMPSYASASTEMAATAIQQMQGATSNRLAATRLHDLDDVSVWAQEIAYGLTREPVDFQGQEFRGHGFGIAAGIDGPLNSGGLFGLSASFITSEVEEPGRPEGEISASFGQLNAYLGTAMGPVDLDFIGGLGAGRMQSRRFVEIGDTFSALSEADWWAFEGHGAVRASVPMRLSSVFVVTPQAALTYVGLSEQGYTESGGGDAIDYEVGDAFSQRLWADVGVELGARLELRGGAVIAPRLYAGYRANALDDGGERDFRFVSGTEEFTLTDEGVGDGGPLLGLGIDATNGYSTFSLSYEGEFGDQIERHSLNAAIRFRF